MSTRPEVPFWPKVHALIEPDGGGEVTVNGVRHPIDAADVVAAREQARELVAARVAAPINRAVRLAAVDPDGQWELIVHPDGSVQPADSQPASRSPRSSRRAPPPSPAFASTPSTPSEPPNIEAVDMPTPTPAPTPTPTPTLADLIAARPHPPTGPAQHGWRAGLRRVTGGLISPAPGSAERAHRHAVSSVQRSLNGPKTVVVVNPKGGANKTTATLLLAATFGICRGGYTLAWDNNETRGTLGWRATPARHTNTAVNLLADLDRFANSPNSRVGDLDNYIRSQGPAQFDVLASDEDAASAASIDADAFGRLHATLSRFYRIMVIDTGNNMRASNWQAAVRAADQLVIVSTIREDTAQSAAWLIDALTASGHQAAVRHAVTVLASPARRADSDLRRRLHRHFGQLTRAVRDVPYDRSLVGGGPIAYDALAPETRQAWLHAAAAVADGLDHRPGP